MGQNDVHGWIERCRSLIFIACKLEIMRLSVRSDDVGCHIHGGSCHIHDPVGSDQGQGVKISVILADLKIESTGSLLQVLETMTCIWNKVGTEGNHLAGIL